MPDQPTIRQQGEGVKIKLSAIPGLTVDDKGRNPLPQDFIFQCPPLEEFKITRAFTFGNYDTIYDGQFTRRGSRQLKVWQFDTLAMYLGAAESNGQVFPSWVPFPGFSESGLPSSPEWYARQLATLHFAGCPFNFVASFANNSLGHSGLLPESSVSASPIMITKATLLQYDEGHKAGEGDAIYFEGLSFQEWRDPSLHQAGLGKARGSVHTPTWVELDAKTGVVHWGDKLPLDHHKATLAGLAKWAYGDPGEWRLIARANSLQSGGSANTILTKFPRFAHKRQKSFRLTIPARPHQKTVKTLQDRPTGVATLPSRGQVP